ncbi:MAG: imidazolonepropionase, partial [Promethearchaeota archaeon]
MFVASTYMKKEIFSENEPDIVIFHANELVTMNSIFGAPRIGEEMSELAIIQDGAIAIKDERIVFVGTTDELLSRFSLEKIAIKIDASNKLVSPGFIDPHTHLIFDGTRENELAMKLLGKSYIEILREGGGILRTVEATRKATLEKLVENGKKILDRMLTHGTTTVEIKSGYGLTTLSEIKILKAAKILDKEHPLDVISTFLGAHAIPEEFKNKTDNYVNLIITEMIPKIVEKNLAEFCD